MNSQLWVVLAIISPALALISAMAIDLLLELIKLLLMKRRYERKLKKMREGLE